MTLELRKFNLIQLLVQLNDEQLISKMEDLLRQERIKGYEDNLKPMTKEALINRALQSEADIKAGRVIDIENLEKEMEKW